MGVYQYLREMWKQPQESLKTEMQQRLIQWRQEPSTLRLDHPTRLDRARSLGFKAKPGIFVVRQRLQRGGHWKPKPDGGSRKTGTPSIVVIRSRSGSAFRVRTMTGTPCWCSAATNKRHWFSDPPMSGWYRSINMQMRDLIVVCRRKSC